MNKQEKATLAHLLAALPMNAPVFIYRRLRPRELEALAEGIIDNLIKHTKLLESCGDCEVLMISGGPSGRKSGKTLPIEIIIGEKAMDTKPERIAPKELETEPDIVALAAATVQASKALLDYYITKKEITIP